MDIDYETPGHVDWLFNEGDSDSEVLSIELNRTRMHMVQSKYSISIIIPVYNNFAGLSDTLESIKPLSEFDWVNVIVVDNNSDIPVIDQFGSDQLGELQIIRETNVQSSYAARNTGIRKSDADILAFLDADVTVSDDWLTGSLEAMYSSGADYLGTSVQLRPPTPPTIASRFDLYTAFPVRQYLAYQHFAPTSSLFVRRSVFEEVGLFDHRLISGGDKEFGNRVFENGFTMHYAENVNAFHPTRNSLTELIEKDLRIGRGHCQLQRYHSDRYGDPGIPPRPSGVKSPDGPISASDRLLFNILSIFLTGVRGAGYYQEYFSPTPAPDIEDIPTLD